MPDVCAYSAVARRDLALWDDTKRGEERMSVSPIDGSDMTVEGMLIVIGIVILAGIAFGIIGWFIHRYDWDKEVLKK